MTSLYGQFVKERFGKDIIENDKGFISYILTNEGMYISDMYVHPDFRKQRVGSRLADAVAEIGRQKGASRIYTSVCVSGEDGTEGLKAILAYGFKVVRAAEGAIWLAKEI